MRRALQAFLEFATVGVLLATTLGFSFLALSAEKGGADAALTAAMVFIVLLMWVALLLGGGRWVSGIARPLQGENLATQPDLAENLFRRLRPSVFSCPLGERCPPGAADAVVDREAADRGPGALALGQSALIALGLVGTFLGLTYGLLNADGLSQGTEKQQEAMATLMGGAKLAFIKSLAGIWCAMLWSVRFRDLENNVAGRWAQWVEWLEEQVPPVSGERLQAFSIESQERMIRAAQEGAVASRALAKEQSHTKAAIVTLAETMREEVRSIRTEVHNLRTATLPQHGEQLQASFKQASLSTITAIDAQREVMGQHAATLQSELQHLVETMRDLSEELPESIGGQTSALLMPHFQDLTTALQRLSNVGGDAVGSVVAQSMDQELGSLRSSLTEVANVLNELGPRVDAQLSDAQQRMTNGADVAARALTEAGTLASREMRSAAGELSSGGEVFAMTLEEIRAALGETKTIADALRGAGRDVGDSLRDVTQPLVALPTALDGARVALVDAHQGLERGNRAHGQQAERLERLAGLLTVAEAAQTELNQASAKVAAEVHEVMVACQATVTALGEASANQHVAGNQATADLSATIQEFRGSLLDTQKSMAGVSQSTFDDAQLITQQAAERLASTLQDGAATMEATLGRLATFGDELQQGLAGARDVAVAIEGHAVGLRDGVEQVVGPFTDVAAALGAVAPEVNQATAAVRAEREALGALGKEISSQSSALSLSSQSLGQRILEYKQLQSTMGEEWARHVQGVDALLERIKTSWAQAVEGADSGVSLNARQLATYARKVEGALRLPNDLRHLDETLAELVDVLDDLKGAVASR